MSRVGWCAEGGRGVGEDAAGGLGRGGLAGGGLGRHRSPCLAFVSGRRKACRDGRLFVFYPISPVYQVGL